MGAGGQLATASHFVIVLSRNIKDMHYDAEYIKYMMNDIIGLPEDTQKIRYEFFKSSRKQILTYYNPIVLYLIGHLNKLILL